MLLCILYHLPTLPTRYLHHGLSSRHLLRDVVFPFPGEGTSRRLAVAHAFFRRRRGRASTRMECIECSGDHSLVQPQMYPFAPSNIRCSLPEVASPLDRCSTASSSTYSDAFSTFTEELAMPARDTSQQPFFSIHHGSDSALTSTYPTLDPNLDIDLGNVIGAPVPAVNSAEFQEALDALVIQIPGTQLSTSLTWNASTSHGDAGETVAPALHGFSRMSDFMQLLRIAHPSCFPDASTSAYSLPQVPAHLAAPSSYCAPPFATPSEMRPPEPAGPILHHPRPFRPDIPEALKNFTRMIEGSASPPSPDIPPAQVGPSIGLGSHGYTLNSTHSLLLQPVAASVRAPHECSENAPHAPYPAAWPQAQMQEDFDMDAALSSLPGGSDAVASHPGEEYALPDWYRCNYGASGMGSW
ncbi:hypothetical protein B0H21DRAFT_130690 [Amylocystis lapponica]|nr:hypothetical protein B0H21DRAFT_130690 [Amylocystis lapponica]